MRRGLVELPENYIKWRHFMTTMMDVGVSWKD